MTSLESAFIPFAAFWLTINSIFGAARIVNDLRETIIIGSRPGDPVGVKLTLNHRRAMFFDWLLMMFGTILATLLFSVFLIYIVSEGYPDTKSVIRFASIFPFMGTLLFALCGISDFQIIKRTLDEQGDNERRRG